MILFLPLIPAKAGIQAESGIRSQRPTFQRRLDSRLRGNERVMI
jgi:hypothetical protein